MTDKTADLAGPGIGDYTELETVLPDDYDSLLTPRATMEALFMPPRPPSKKGSVANSG